MQTRHVIVRTKTSTFGRTPSASAVNAYAAAIRRYDLLQPDQEQRLARRWQETRDPDAANVLVTSHLRLAARLARGYRGYGLPLADLIAEANLGLVIAASRFEAGRGARFSSYAVWWVKATIHEYILRSWSLVRIGTTTAQRKLFFRLRSEMRRATGGEMAGLTLEAARMIAGRLDVATRDVIEMDSRLNGDLSLNARVGCDEEGAEWQSLLVDDAIDAETVIAEQEQTERRTNALRLALDVLTERERRVLEARRLAEHPRTLEQLGRELSISSERVRQIEICAFARVRRAVVLAAQNAACAFESRGRVSPAPRDYSRGVTESTPEELTSL
ncbi:RNA polymerase sigma-32 factor [Bradyrhizobium ottawaense]|uniref:RNA polymerase sigma factor RpoH n=1 Tax=Bradyrhizobium ottawaense TaxID=931866 RepID=A0A2U8PHS9_9BRAD|nr:RNA polymerase sigma factor RpoH [Bradyrhizobium ottawaense]AWL97064.1 RNA polymerase sigma factor RpoH [Bradyrhizobium ottawaense]MBR1333347.1 RNA polymerase sigma factor RpoH [Bradyrhizobium ottawaense]